MTIWIQALGAVTAIGLVYKVYDYVLRVSRFRTTPLYHVITFPGSLIGEIFPPTLTWLTRGGMHSFFAKHDTYFNAGWNAYVTLSPLPSNSAVMWIADAAVNKEITNNPKRFLKPLELYEPLKIFGPGVVVVEGETWKRHRKVSQPAFSEKNNRLVWKAGLDIMNELMDDVWGNKEQIVLPNVCDSTIRIALMILTIAGFGQPSSWETEAEIPKGHKMNFTTAIYISCTNLVMKIVTPKWAVGLTKPTREMHTGFEELGKYMDEMIMERQAANKGGEASQKADLLTNLIGASEESVSSGGTVGPQLNLEELRGNVFTYLIAGHETNAHGLAYTLGLLALYPDEQEKVYRHIKEVLGDRTPTYEDFPALSLVLGTYYEGLRMFPPVNVIPKYTTQDEVFTVSSATGDESKSMSIPAGTTLYLHAVGMHYNPKYWKDPHSFRPGRFTEEWNRDAFLSFSAGLRSCIGRKFAEVEGVSVLTSLLSRYSIHLAPEMEVQLSGLSRHEQIERLMKSESKITLTPVDLPLMFKRRT